MSAPRSESTALRKVRATLHRVLRSARLTEADHHALDAALTEVDTLLAQVGRGVHPNPLLAVYGLNPGHCFSEHVMAVVYVHKEDGELYCHGFGNADLGLTTHRDGSLTIRGMRERTGVRMVAERDGSVRLVKPGVALTEDF